MIVSLPCTTLKEGAASARASIAGKAGSILFSQTPSLKHLIESVLHQPRTRPIRKSSTSEEEPIKPEDEAKIIVAVEQTPPTHDQKQIVKAIAGHLLTLIDESAQLPEFEGKNVPSISIPDYVDRLIRYIDAWAGEKPSLGSTGVSAAILGVEYLDRLNIPFSSKSIHRLYMASVLVAVKFTEDFSISNRFWAKVAGIDLDEMNRLELSFCKALNWKLKISREDFESQQVRFGEPMF